jgi:DNA-directed RNA polymerase specialized sigma24 family protein
MEDVAIAPLEAAANLSPVDPEPAVVVLRSPEQAERLVLDLIAAHADSLLRTARRYSLCADDAQDAYQRGLEILLRHAARLDSDRAGGWLHTVVNHHNDTWRRGAEPRPPRSIPRGASRCWVHLSPTSPRSRFHAEEQRSPPALPLFVPAERPRRL